MKVEIIFETGKATLRLVPHSDEEAAILRAAAVYKKMEPTLDLVDDGISVLARSNRERDVASLTIEMWTPGADAKCAGPEPGIGAQYNPKDLKTSKI